MGLVKSVLGVLFGKQPKIFDENGEVQHQLPKKTWDAWQNKAKGNPEYDWRNHNGTRYRKK